MTNATELDHYHHFQKTRVQMKGLQTPGRVSHAFDASRSYVVETASGQVRRNRSHLRTHSEDEQAVVPAELLLVPLDQSPDLKLELLYIYLTI